MAPGDFADVFPRVRPVSTWWDEGVEGHSALSSDNDEDVWGVDGLSFAWEQPRGAGNAQTYAAGHWRPLREKICELQRDLAEVERKICKYHIMLDQQPLRTRNRIPWVTRQQRSATSVRARYAGALMSLRGDITGVVIDDGRKSARCNDSEVDSDSPAKKPLPPPSPRPFRKGGIQHMARSANALQSRIDIMQQPVVQPTFRMSGPEVPNGDTLHYMSSLHSAVAAVPFPQPFELGPSTTDLKANLTFEGAYHPRMSTDTFKEPHHTVSANHHSPAPHSEVEQTTRLHHSSTTVTPDGASIEADANLVLHGSNPETEKEFRILGSHETLLSSCLTDQDEKRTRQGLHKIQPSSCASIDADPNLVLNGSNPEIEKDLTLLGSYKSLPSPRYADQDEDLTIQGPHKIRSSSRDAYQNQLCCTLQHTKVASHEDLTLSGSYKSYQSKRGALHDAVLHEPRLQSIVAWQNTSPDQCEVQSREQECDPSPAPRAPLQDSIITSLSTKSSLSREGSQLRQFNIPQGQVSVDQMMTGHSQCSSAGAQSGGLASSQNEQSAGRAASVCKERLVEQSINVGQVRCPAVQPERGMGTHGGFYQGVAPDAQNLLPTSVKEFSQDQNRGHEQKLNQHISHESGLSSETRSCLLCDEYQEGSIVAACQDAEITYKPLLAEAAKRADVTKVPKFASAEEEEQGDEDEEDEDKEEAKGHKEGGEEEEEEEEEEDEDEEEEEEEEIEETEDEEEEDDGDDSDGFDRKQQAAKE